MDGGPIDSPDDELGRADPTSEMTSLPDEEEKGQEIAKARERSA